MSPKARLLVRRRSRPAPAAPTTAEILQALPVPLLWQEGAGRPLCANAAYHARWAALPECAQLEQPGATLIRLPTPDGPLRYARLSAHPAPALLQGLHRCWTAEDVHDFLVDALTGLPTRQAWERERLPCPVSPALHVTLLDLNGFKAVNDTHGHAAGDAALRLLGRLLAQACAGRPVQAYRLGGDEFLLAGCGDNGVNLGQLEREFQASARRDLGLTGLSFAVGQAAAPRDGQRVSELMRVADARMYRAKHAGRAGTRPLGVRGTLIRLVSERQAALKFAPPLWTAARGEAWSF